MACNCWNPTRNCKECGSRLFKWQQYVPQRLDYFREKKTDIQICPVCGGTGFVNAGFYTTTTGRWSTSSLLQEVCRSCMGHGYVVVVYTEEE